VRGSLRNIERKEVKPNGHEEARREEGHEEARREEEVGKATSFSRRTLSDGRR
jgi:hypothetical protein